MTDSVYGEPLRKIKRWLITNEAVLQLLDVHHELALFGLFLILDLVNLGL